MAFDLYEIVTRMAQPAGEPFKNVWHFQADIGTDPVDIMVGLATVFEGGIFQDMPVSVAYTGASWQDVGSESQPITDVTFPTPYYGENASTQMLPPQSAALCQFRATASRPNLARKYLAGFVEDAQNGGLWGVGTQERLVDFMGRMLDFRDFASVSADYIVLRKTRTPTYFVEYNVLTSGQTRGVVRTIRSRTRGS